MKVCKFIEDYYYKRAVKGLRKSTIIGYKSSIDLYILPTFGKMDFEDITVEMLEDWIDGIEKEGAAFKAYKTFRQIIRKAIDYDVFEGKDPTTKHIKVARKPRREPKILDGREVGELLEGFRGHYLEATIICAVTLGLRRGEAFGLTWEDIDLRSGKVKIKRSYQKIAGEVLVLPPKTEKSKRICWLPKSASVRMRDLGRGKTGRISIVDQPDQMAKDYKEHCKKNNLPYTSFTNLRHTWATLALEGGADIVTIANMLGHTDIMTAYNHYIVPRDKTYRKTQKMVDNLINW